MQSFSLDLGQSCADVVRHSAVARVPLVAGIVVISGLPRVSMSWMQGCSGNPVTFVMAKYTLYAYKKLAVCIAGDGRKGIKC